MKLLLENWREYLSELVDNTPMWKVLVKTDQNIKNMIGYHASSAVFDQFDNSRLGSNTDMGKAGENKYNLDSYLGHMFVPDSKQLEPHIGKLVGDGNTPYMYSVTLTPGRVAVIDIRQFKKWFGKNDPNAKARLRQFGKWLKDKGYGGLRYMDSKSDTTLMSDTIQVFDASNTRIRSIWNKHSDKRIATKDLQQGQSFADAFKADK